MTSIVTFRAEDGAALGRILTLSDISQVRRLAMEKERFIRTMVHEMKSPLGAVRASSRSPPTRAWATTSTPTCPC